MLTKDLRYWFEIYKNNRNGTQISKEDYDKLNQIMDYVLENFDIDQDNQIFEYYLESDRGSFEENLYEGEIEELDPEDIEFLMKSFYEEYPDEKEIHKITIKRFDNQWFLLQLDDNHFFTIDPSIFTDLIS